MNNIVCFAPAIDIFFLRATVFGASSKKRKKFNDKNPSVKRWRSIVRNKLNPEMFLVSLEIVPDACKKLQNPLPPQAQTNGTTGPPGVNEDESRFPGKSIALQTSFVISIAEWSVQEDSFSYWFSMGKDSSTGKKLPRVNFKQNRRITWETSSTMSGCRKNSMRGMRPFARLWHLPD